MALTFDNTSADRVNYGTAAACENLNPGCYMGWFKRNAGSVGMTGMSHRNERPSWITSSGTGRQWNFRWKASGTNMDIRTNQDQPDGSWAFWVAEIDLSDSQDMRWYYGTPTAVVAETGYTSITDHTGTLDSNAGKPLVLGNSELFSEGWGGDVAMFAVFNRLTTLQEKITMQFAPRRLPGCCFLSFPGLYAGDTSAQPDFSGNGSTGTPTGTTKSTHFTYASPRWSREVAQAQAGAAPPVGHANRLIDSSRLTTKVGGLLVA